VPVTQIECRGRTFQVSIQHHAWYWERVRRGEWEPETFEVFDRFVDHARPYIDIGSWIGPTVLYAAQITNRVYGIEPDPIAFSELLENVTLNRSRMGEVALFNGCISTQTGKIAFGSLDSGGDSMSSLLFAEGKTRWLVDSLTFKDFIAQNCITDCGFIKIDIEGGEYQILPTMKAFLRLHRPTVYLSLHPGLLGFPGKSTLIPRLVRVSRRFVKTVGIVGALSGYRHLYDTSGRRMSGTGLLLRSLRGRYQSVIASDRALQ